jgi:hypothetical protein
MCIYNYSHNIDLDLVFIEFFFSFYREDVITA